MAQGWIKLHRKLAKWEWYQDSRMVHLFIHLLLIANREPKQWQGVDIKRGQVITGLKALNADTGISTQTLRTCLLRLEKAGNLTSKSTNRFRLITLCNYETYQIGEIDTNKLTNKQLTINQQATNNQLTPNKKDKKEKTVKKENTPLPPELDTPEFQKTWKEWIQFRIELKKKLTPSTMKSQLKKLAKLPVATAAAMLEQSIQNGWQGIFKLKEDQAGQSTISFAEKETAAKKRLHKESVERIMNDV